jgi:RNA polymerase sigma-70 factor (ECF subfamily)
MTNFSNDLTTHPSLLLRVRDGADHQAWSEFIAIYGPLIYSFCRRRGLQESDAADVCQEVLSRVAGAMGSFEYQSEKGRFRGWLGTITFRELARWSKSKRVPGTTDPDEVEGLEARAIATSDWDDHFHASLLQVALSRIEPYFEPVNWQAFTRVWLNSQPAPEVASQLGITVDKIYVAKSRILKRLRMEVLQMSEDAPLN